MKQIPMLFSTAMVQAIMEGRKTMTRRIVNDQPVYDDINQMRCHYGKVGDMIWVREQHYRWGHWIEKEGEFTKRGVQKWKFVAIDNEVRYEDNKPDVFKISRSKVNPYLPAWYKRLGRFMPKSACRIWLQVTDVRVERLKDITESDAVNEGIATYTPIPELTFYENYSQNKRKDFIKGSDYSFDMGKESQCAAVASFCTLWMEINGRESWISDPWVWVVSFKVLSTTGKPANI